MNVLKNDRYALGQNIKATVAIAESNNKDTAETKEETKEAKTPVPTASDVEKALAKELSDPRIGGFTGNILQAERKSIGVVAVVGRFMGSKIVLRHDSDGATIRSNDGTRDLAVAVITIEQSDGTTIKALTDSKYYQGLGLFVPNQLVSLKVQYVQKGDRFDLGKGNVSVAKSDSIKLDDMSPCSIMVYYNAVGSHIETNLADNEKAIARANMTMSMKMDFQMQAMLAQQQAPTLDVAEELAV